MKITGRIIDQNNGDVVAKAKVVIKDGATAISGPCETKQEGKFVCESGGDVEGRQLTVSVKAENYWDNEDKKFVYTQDTDVGDVRIKPKTSELKPDDDRKPIRGHNIPWGKIGLAVGAVVVGVALVLFLWPRPFTVPNVTTRTLAEASDILTKAGLRMEVETVSTFAEKPGMVFDQKPKHPELVKKNQKVIVFVVAEIPLVPLPRLVGHSTNEVLGMTDMAHLEFQEEGPFATNNLRPGYVSAQDPDPASGTKMVPSNSVVRYWVQPTQKPTIYGTWTNENPRAPNENFSLVTIQLINKQTTVSLSLRVPDSRPIPSAPIKAKIDSTGEIVTVNDGIVQLKLTLLPGGRQLSVRAVIKEKTGRVTLDATEYFNRLRLMRAGSRSAIRVQPRP